MKNIKIIFASEKEKQKYQRKYKCPYCDYKNIRTKLVSHIQSKHADLIPEGMTALQIVFNVVNNKKENHGDCIICKEPTPWNESKGRYDRLCGREYCKEKYKEMVRKRNKDKYGTEDPNNDERYKEDIQNKALSRRKISGKYTFKDGGVISYVGSYEKNLLEFLDTVMNVQSIDLQAPGPSLKYQYKGGEHLYISDFYYVPYNLIIEVKDGGKNPNTNPEVMKQKQERQTAKEEAVYKNTSYNYIRLTDNDFGQLMSAMAVLKYNMDDERYFKVNEMYEVYNAKIIKETSMFGIDPKIIEDIEKEINTYLQPTTSEMELLDRQLFDIEGVLSNGRHV